MHVLTYLCAGFYALLCVFSIVTGIMYMTGKRELNPLELSDSFVEKLSEEGNLQKFARFMGFVTFVVGLAQGLAAYAILHGDNAGLHVYAIGFTIFSICSVLFKLKGKISAFPLLKLVAYVAILVVLLVG